MAPTGEAKADLLRYLRAARDALLWKLEGLDELDLRRPLTPTGTNLLGLVKHVASTQIEYVGLVFGRPSGEPLPWTADDAEPNADMWATAEESRAEVLALYARAWEVTEVTEATVAALDLDAEGHVPWWPDDRNPVTLHQVLVHLVAETHRHAGHADVVRELVDGSAGLRRGNANLPDVGPDFWPAYRDRLQQAAQDAAARWPGDRTPETDG